MPFVFLIENGTLRCSIEDIRSKGGLSILMSAKCPSSRHLRHILCRIRTD